MLLKMYVEDLKHCTITRYTHFFKVTDFTEKVKGVCFRFSADYTANKTYERDIDNVKGATFGAYVQGDAQEFRFHIGQLKDFLRYLSYNGVRDYCIEVIDKPLYDPMPIHTKLIEGKEPYDYQIPAIQWATDPQVKGLSRLISADPGTGKTLMAMRSAHNQAKRVVVMVLPKYVQKWRADIKDYVQCSDSQITVVESTKHLKKLMLQCSQDEHHANEFTVLSLKLFSIYINNYERDPIETISPDSYGFSPDKIFEVFGTGLVIIDEVHEHLHAVFKAMLYTHGPLLLGLSGTFLDKDPFLSHIQSLMFPSEYRYTDIKAAKYVHAISLAYRFKQRNNFRLKTSERGSPMYSQNAFETSLLKAKDKTVMSNFTDLICYAIDQWWRYDYKKGDKLGIYFFKTDMCTEMVKRLKLRYPDLDIRPYFEGHPYKNAIEADIRVTTMLSCGTAVDIKNMTTIISAHMCETLRGNLQLHYRLRELKNDPSRISRHVWLWCEDVPKHMKYDKERTNILKSKSKAMYRYQSPISV